MRYCLPFPVRVSITQLSTVSKGVLNITKKETIRKAVVPPRVAQMSHPKG